MTAQTLWKHRISGPPRKRGWNDRVHPAWEYNTIPSADREWMARNQSDLDKASLSRSITGGCDNDNEE